MSRFHGPQPGYKGHDRTKGVLRRYREQLRIEAEARNELTEPERRASFRRAQLEEEVSHDGNQDNSGHVTRSEKRKTRNRTRKGKSTRVAADSSNSEGELSLPDSAASL